MALEPMDVELGAVEIVEEADRATEAAVAVERLRSLEFGEAYYGGADYAADDGLLCAESFAEATGDKSAYGAMGECGGDWPNGIMRSPLGWPIRDGCGMMGACLSIRS